MGRESLQASQSARGSTSAPGNSFRLISVLFFLPRNRLKNRFTLRRAISAQQRDASADARTERRHVELTRSLDDDEQEK